MLCVLVAALAQAATATAAPRDTTVRTIQDTDGDNLLEFAPGEDHCVFTLTLTPSHRTARRRAHRHARPSRSSTSCSSPTSRSSTRSRPPASRPSTRPSASPAPTRSRPPTGPQESLTTQITEAMVRQARNTTSPITGARLALTILTGDNADSQQYNETRWFIDMLDGTTGGGNPDPEMDARAARPQDRARLRHRGAGRAGCGPGYADNGSPYDGVRDDGGPGQDTGYYEPDGEGDGDGYTPDRARNQAEVPGPHADVTVRDFPRPVRERAGAVRGGRRSGMPWYSAFGNHDALVQGNSGERYVGPFGNADAAGGRQPGVRRDRPRLRQADQAARRRDARGVHRGPAAASDDPGAESMIVPPDPRRCFLAKDEPNTALPPCSTGGWIQQHNRTTGLPAGHGFEPFAVDGQSGAGRPGERGARPRRLLLVRAPAGRAVRRARHDHRRVRRARLRRGLGRRPAVPVARGRGHRGGRGRPVRAGLLAPHAADDPLPVHRPDRAADPLRRAPGPQGPASPSARTRRLARRSRTCSAATTTCSRT